MILNNETPISEAVVDDLMMLTSPWRDFFSRVTDLLFYGGVEKSATLLNNQAVTTLIPDLSFDKRYVSAGYVDYIIQRTTDTNEAVESGTFFTSYKNKTNTWQLTNGPTTSGVTITINANGQCLYQTTNQTGVISLSRIVFRARSIRAKSKTYSLMGNAGAT